ncbi:hypothetical protein J6590_024009 [Homalodisca vitripennis]|nr:hypothetical protein J6590_024009 [Homalodisca vitripennis]
MVTSMFSLSLALSAKYRGISVNGTARQDICTMKPTLKARYISEKYFPTKVTVLIF